MMNPMTVPMMTDPMTNPMTIKINIWFRTHLCYPAVTLSVYTV